jgi:hypothetical protein
LSQVPSLEPMFGPGTPMTQFARRIQNAGSTPAAVFVYKANVPGLEFYLGRPVYTIRSPAKDLLPMTPEQRARVISSSADCAALAPPGQPVFGVVKRRAVGTDFSTNTWEMVEATDRYALIQRKETGWRGNL